MMYYETCLYYIMYMKPFMYYIMKMTLTCKVKQELHSKASLVQRGLMLLTLTTVPLMDTNFPVIQNNLKQQVCNSV